MGSELLRGVLLRLCSVSDSCARRNKHICFVLPTFLFPEHIVRARKALSELSFDRRTLADQRTLSRESMEPVRGWERSLNCRKHGGQQRIYWRVRRRGQRIVASHEGFSGGGLARALHGHHAFQNPEFCALAEATIDGGLFSCSWEAPLVRGLWYYFSDEFGFVGGARRLRRSRQMVWALGH